MLELVDQDFKTANTIIVTELKQTVVIGWKESMMTTTKQIASLNRKIETIIKNQMKIL